MVICFASKCKVNANIGASSNPFDATEDVNQPNLSVQYAANTVKYLLLVGSISMRCVR